MLEGEDVEAVAAGGDKKDVAEREQRTSLRERDRALQVYYLQIIIHKPEEVAQMPYRGPALRGSDERGDGGVGVCLGGGEGAVDTVDEAAYLCAQIRRRRRARNRHLH
jgi:hypothetical protein